LYGNNFIHLYQKKNLELNSRLSVIWLLYYTHGVSAFAKKVEVKKETIPSVLHKYYFV
jgi:hypothetical protein